MLATFGFNKTLDVKVTWVYFCSLTFILHFLNHSSIGSAKYLFFGKCFKETTEYYLKFLFLFKSIILPVNKGKIKWLHRLAMQQPTRSVQFLNTLSIVCNCISPMASRILSFKASIVSELVSVTLIFDSTPQIIDQRCQIAAPRQPNDICSAADNAIFKNRAQNIEYSFGWVARSAR